MVTPISLTRFGSAYTQNFDTLSNTAGSTTNTLSLAGWLLNESGGGVRDNEQYAVDNGGSNVGDTYSFGSAGSIERALGSIRAGTLIPTFGATFVNDTGGTITALDLSYVGEEWRLGTSGRSDSLTFEYSLDATDLTSGTWTSLHQLDFSTLDTTTVGAKDGNASGFHTSLSGTISGLHVAQGATFFIRWTDNDASSNDDGLAVDNFSLTAHGTNIDAGQFGDFDGVGDGKADVLWRNDDGGVAIWQMNGGSLTAGNFLPTVPTSWHILGTGDFNGDGKTDVLWLNDDGTLLDWQMASSSQIGSTPGLGNAPANSVLAGIGDVDGDHKSDLLWRDSTSGAVTINTMAGASGTNSTVGLDWKVIGSGDFNGDGKADVLFRHDGDNVVAYWQLNGTTVQNTIFVGGVPADWHVVGAGDFDGNGVSDVFWHNDNGANAAWLMGSNGQLQQAAFFAGVSSDWHVVGTGNFDGNTSNGHPVDDVIWRNDNGATSVWLMNGASTPVVSFPGGAPSDWTTQAHAYDFV